MAVLARSSLGHYGWLPAAAQLAANAGFSPDVVNDLSVSALDYVTRGPVIEPGRSGRMDARIA